MLPADFPYQTLNTQYIMGVSCSPGVRERHERKERKLVARANGGSGTRRDREGDGEERKQEPKLGWQPAVVVGQKLSEQRLRSPSGGEPLVTRVAFSATTLAFQNNSLCLNCLLPWIAQRPPFGATPMLHFFYIDFVCRCKTQHLCSLSTLSPFPLRLLDHSPSIPSCN